MPVELNKIIEQAKALWAKLTLPRRIALGAVLALVVAGVLFAALRTPASDDTVLFSELSSEDAAAVVEQLKVEKVAYRLEAGGATIMVPTARVHELRLAMASRGVPRGGGVGFEVFDKQAFGATSFVEKMNYHRALSGELARSVMTIAQVEHARVQVALPDRSLYAAKDEPPTASVVLKLKPGRELTRDQVRGIVHLVTRPVQRLTAENVSVVDEAGTVLWPDDETRTTADDQRKLERELTRRVANIVEQIVGPGRSVVSVTSEFDHTLREELEDVYDKDRTAPRSVQKSEEVVTAPVNTSGGIAGARGNLAGTAAADPNAPPPSPADPTKKKITETLNNDITHVTRKTLGPKVQLKRLHVAVLVDGWEQGLAEAHLAALEAGRAAMRAARESAELALTTTQTSSLAGVLSSSASATAAIGLAQAAPKPGREAVKFPKKMRIRTAKELANIALLASRAAGLDPSRGDAIEVHANPFHDQLDLEEPPPPPPGLLEQLTKVQLAVLAAALSSVLLASLAFAVWRLRKARRLPVMVEPETLPVLPLTAAEAENALSDAPPTSVIADATPEELSIRDQAIELARANPEKAARILASWLSQVPPPPAVVHLPPPTANADARANQGVRP